MLTDRQREVMALRAEGLDFKAIGARLGIAGQTAHKCFHAGKKKLEEKSARLDPGIQGTLDRLGMGDLAGQHSGWVHREDQKTGEWASVYYYLGKDGAPAEADIEEILGRAVEKVFRGDVARRVKPRATGDHLLVIDIADLHIGKLCLKSETGFSYDREEALRRGLEGCRALLDKATRHGVAHILFVIGNDVMHIDDPRGRTTSGTPQDTDGTQAIMFDDALAFYVACIDLCRRVAPVSVIYCPSNHDWMSGYMLARALRAWFRNCPEVAASEYNTSHRHRKYFRFGRNLIGVTHADGAKEADLGPLMVEEATDHLADACFRVWYLHHFHHKIRRRGFGSDRRQIEKDQIGMTVIQGSAGLVRGDAAEIEYIRSPSPPDGWHDRNGYINRQAVEAFLHHPNDGPCARFTEYF